MVEYIDKADLLKRLESRIKDYGRDCNINAPVISRTYQEVLQMVKNLPIADVVPVVRCKDCKWLYKPSLLCTHKRNRVFNTGIERDFNCYCSYGERRCKE